MEIRVFDENKNVTTIDGRDIIMIKRVKRRLCYETSKGMFYGSVNLEEEAMLRFEKEFRLIDKNSLINMDQVEYILNGYAYSHGKKYPISHRKRPMINRIWNDRNK